MSKDFVDFRKYKIIFVFFSWKVFENFIFVILLFFLIVYIFEGNVEKFCILVSVLR